MDYLFGKTGQRHLKALAATSTLYAFDFDGTLAPLVDRPERAHIPADTAELFQQLSDLAPTAIISGRAVQTLEQLISVRVGYLVGNHGLEGFPIQKKISSDAKKIVVRWRSQMPDVKAPLFVEDKEYSVALHYRDAKDKRQARAQLLKLAEGLRPHPRIIMGKLVINLVPSHSSHKGTALVNVLKQSKMENALYIGDDDTDEDVFRYVDENKLKAHVVTVRVGYRKKSAAHYFIRRQSEINRLLKSLNHDLVASRSHARIG